MLSDLVAVIKALLSKNMLKDDRSVMLGNDSIDSLSIYNAGKVSRFYF